MPYLVENLKQVLNQRSRYETERKMGKIHIDTHFSPIFIENPALKNCFFGPKYTGVQSLNDREKLAKVGILDARAKYRTGAIGGYPDFQKSLFPFFFFLVMLASPPAVVFCRHR